MKKKYTEKTVVFLIASIRELANNRISECLQAQGIADLLPVHGAVLHALFSENKLSMSELAKFIGRKKNTVTNLIAALEERGYCYRENDPHDGRSQLIFLTLKGEKFRKIQKKISEQILKEAWEGTSKQDKDACLRGLQTMLANLEKAKHTEIKI